MDAHTSIRSLSQSLVEEVFAAMGESGRHWSRQALRPLIWAASTRVSRLFARYEQEIQQFGFRHAVQGLLGNLITSYQAHGVERVPQTGPLLVVSNHPGTFDSLLIAATLPRDDLHIMANGYSFLRQLPTARQHLIFTSRETTDRMAALRRSIRHLQEGASLLIFPSGNVDPDPAVLPEAESYLSRWSPSVELMLKKVPDAHVLVTIVSGVLSDRWANSPLMRFWRDQLRRQNAAGVVQIIRQMLVPLRLKLRPRISFGEPLRLEQLQQVAVTGILDEIIADARELLRAHLRDWWSEPLTTLGRGTRMPSRLV